MIPVAHDQWGTAAEIADQIGQGVTEDAVRWWARHDGLESIRIKGPLGRPRVLFPLSQAIQIEKAKRDSARGRPRGT